MTRRLNLGTLSLSAAHWTDLSWYLTSPLLPSPPTLLRTLWGLAQDWPCRCICTHVAVLLRIKHEANDLGRRATPAIPQPVVINYTSGSLRTLCLLQSHLTVARLFRNKLNWISKMTAYSLFNNCTIEDMNQHLFALAAGSHHALLPRVEFSPARLRMKITVDEVKAPGQTSKTSVRDYWLPGERVTGNISIESKNPITLAHARIRLDGKNILTPGSQLPRATGG